MKSAYSSENIDRIQALARQLRTKYKSMEWGVTPVDLMKKEGLDYDEYKLNTENGKGTILQRGVSAITKVIKAAIFPKDGVVLIDTDLHDSKKPFGQGHELGHHAIPEHREIFYLCSEHDLHPETRSSMEFEANIFAAELLFPSPLLSAVHSKFPLSMETILHLASLSGASIHSAAIKYVRSSPHECCLLTLKIDTDEEARRGLRLENQISSSSWHAKYGKLIADGQFLPENHNLSLVVFSGNADEIVKTTVNVKEKQLTFGVHAFFNSYKVLALLLR